MGLSMSSRSLVLKSVDLLLEELEGGEEDRVDGARAAHGYAQTAVHVSLEELDLDRLDLLALRVHQAVSLVDALCGVNRI